MPHVYTDPSSREPFFSPHTFSKKSLTSSSASTVLHPPPPPFPLLLLAYVTEIRIPSLENLSISNQRRFRVENCGLQKYEEPHNQDIRPYLLQILQFWYCMLIVIADQHHYCTFSTWLWCTIFMFPKNCDIITFRRPFSGQFFQVFNFENLKKLQICLVYCTALLLTSLERRESWSLILRPPWGPDLMFINANTNHAISARLFHFTWWRGVRSRGLCNWRPTLWTHFKWQNISIHHQNVNFTHFLMKWLILGTTFWKHVKKWQL